MSSLHSVELDLITFTLSSRIKNFKDVIHSLPISRLPIRVNVKTEIETEFTQLR